MAEPGIGRVVLVAVTVVAVVLGAAALTAVLPSELRAVVTGTPLTILVLIGGTAAVLIGIARRGRPRA